MAYAALLGLVAGGTQPARGLIWPDHSDPKSPAATFMRTVVVPADAVINVVNDETPTFRPAATLLVVFPGGGVMDTKRSTCNRWLAAAVGLASVAAVLAAGPTTGPASARPIRTAPVSAMTARALVPAGYSVVGLDVSNHQGGINWAQVAASGQRFSYAKASEGGLLHRPVLRRQQRRGQGNGLYAGAVPYARPDTSTGRAQADYFLRPGAVQQRRSYPAADARHRVALGGVREPVPLLRPDSGGAGELDPRLRGP